MCKFDNYKLQMEVMKFYKHHNIESTSYLSAWRWWTLYVKEYKMEMFN